MTYLVYLVMIALMVCAYAWAWRWDQGRPGAWVPLAALGLTTGWFLLHASGPTEPFKDFLKSYWPAGCLVWTDPAAMYSKGVGGFVNLPIFAVPFTPLCALDARAASAVIGVGSVLVLLAAAFMLFRLGAIAWPGHVVVLCLFLVNGPLYYSLREGNLTHLIFPLLVLALVCLHRRWDLSAGALLGLCAAVKLPLLLLCGYLLARRRWRAFVGSALAVGVIAGASLWLFGRELHGVWLERAVLPFMGRPVAAYNVQTVDGFVARLFAPDNLRNWGPLDLGIPFTLLRWAARLTLLGCAVWVLGRSGPPRSPRMVNSEFCIALLLALLLSPISWTHYYLYLIIPLSLLAGGRLPGPAARWDGPLLALGALLVSLPNTPVDLPEWVGRGQFSNMLISRFFFGGLLLLGVLLVRHKEPAAKSCGAS